MYPFSSPRTRIGWGKGVYFCKLVSDACITTLLVSITKNINKEMKAGSYKKVL